MSRLSDALGVPENKPFTFEDDTHKIKDGRRWQLTRDGVWLCLDDEVTLTRMINSPNEIKLLPTRYKRKEPEIMEAYRMGNKPVPDWLPRWWLKHVPEGQYITLDPTNELRVYSPEEFESTFEEVE